MKQDLELIRMSDIQPEEVQWLWYPYIPLGKLTVIQGDPGEGKTTFVLAVIAALTKGEALPEREPLDPVNILYQTAEDGLADTIRPRLDALGADCSRVLVIDESKRELSLSDERIRQAMEETGAKLLVLDPLQAYLGAEVDMHRANEVRPILKRLGSVAEQMGCAVVLIRHLNKMQGQKSGHRGMGSVDFQAAARSVLLVGRTKEDPQLRIVVPDKSSLAPEGESIAFPWTRNRDSSGRDTVPTTQRSCWEAPRSRCRLRPCRRKKPCGTCWTNLHRRKKSCGELLR